MKNNVKKEKELRFVNIDNPLRQKHYKALRKNFILRLSATYLAPLIIMTIFFIYQYSVFFKESQSHHHLLIAESQSKILDIFLKERIRNMQSLIDDPKTEFPPSPESIKQYFSNLRRNSDAFIDLSFFDRTGRLNPYVGPLTYLENLNYSNEKWYKYLKQTKNPYIITDSYLGKRKLPHFTMAVMRNINNQMYVFKTTLDQARIYEYLTSLERSGDVLISIINKDEIFQLVPQKMGKTEEKSPFKPMKPLGLGLGKAEIFGKTIDYAYSWLTVTNWAVIVISKDFEKNPIILHPFLLIISVSALLISIVIIIIIIRSKKMVEFEQDKDIVQTQLEQASKLATVGELAAGIAHEIGNPLNIIANEVGIMQDYANPKFNANKSIQDLKPNFDKIMKAVFRCKDINSKLLTFVRQDGVVLKEFDIHDLVEDLVGGFFEREMKVDNIELIRNYGNDLPKVMLDGNQFRQVLINLINNAADAITPPGTVTISTGMDNKNVIVSVTDTGCGISQEQINKIFLPFYTTKPVGKGTGLGLSVSYSIIKHFGGDIKVESIPGKGSTFIILLPFTTII